MKVKRVLTEAGEIALALLRLTSVSADVFPPLKGAASGALHVAEIVVVRLCARIQPRRVLTFRSRNSNQMRRTGPILAGIFRRILHVSSNLFPMTRSPRKICKETWNDCRSENTSFSGDLSFTYVDCCHLSTLNGIIEKIKDLQSVPPLKRAWTFVKDPEKIVGMRKEFDDAIGLFQVCIDLLSFIEKVFILCLYPAS